MLIAFGSMWRARYNSVVFGSSRSKLYQTTDSGLRDCFNDFISLTLLKIRECVWQSRQR